MLTNKHFSKFTSNKRKRKKSRQLHGIAFLGDGNYVNNFSNHGLNDENCIMADILWWFHTCISAKEIWKSITSFTHSLLWEEPNPTLRNWDWERNHFHDVWHLYNVFWRMKNTVQLNHISNNVEIDYLQALGCFFNHSMCQSIHKRDGSREICIPVVIWSNTSHEFFLFLLLTQTALSGKCLQIFWA